MTLVHFLCLVGYPNYKFNIMDQINYCFNNCWGFVQTIMYAIYTHIPGPLQVEVWCKLNSRYFHVLKTIVVYRCLFCVVQWC